MKEFHSPKELRIGLVTELSGLLNEFRLKDEDEEGRRLRRKWLMCCFF